MSSKNSLGIVIKSLNESSFKLNIDDQILKDFNYANVKFGLGFEVESDSKTQEVKFIIKAQFAHKFESGKLVNFLELSTDTTFQFSDIEQNQNEVRFDGESVFMDDKLLIYLLETAVGVTRGMIASKVANLPIKVMLPLIKGEKLLPPEKKSTKTTSKKLKK